ncbi:MAG: hypothetical protein ABFD79_02320 [Phycisphaerales bacterium]
MKNYLILGTVLIFFISNTFGQIVRMNFSGNVKNISISDPQISFDSSIHIGTIMTGYAEYDINRSRISGSMMDSTYALKSFYMSIGNLQSWHKTDSSHFATIRSQCSNIWPVTSSGDSSYRLWSGGEDRQGDIYFNGTATPISDFVWRAFGFQIIIRSNNMVFYDNLLPTPDTFAGLQVFDAEKSFYFSNDSGVNDFVISGDITSFNLIPEPATIAMLIIGGFLARKWEK